LTDFDSIIIINGKASVGNEKTVAILSWFLAGYNLADTILFFGKDKVIVYTSERKSKYFYK
jgi:nucleosome binding factor SPN SPT16 subunit